MGSCKKFETKENTKIYGLDGISNEILNCRSPVIEPAIAAVFNKCIQGRTFPKCLKIAKTIPIFKERDERKSESYRPISLLSSMGIVFEKLLELRRIKFGEKNSIISRNYYGFRSKRSCIKAKGNCV